MNNLNNGLLTINEKEEVNSNKNFDQISLGIINSNLNKKNYPIKKENKQELNFIQFMIFFEKKEVKINQNLNAEVAIFLEENLFIYLGLNGATKSKTVSTLEQ